MNEKYGIELELLTGSFNKQVERIKKTAESIKTAFDPSDVSGMKINGMSQIKGISKEVNKLKGKRYGLSEVLELQKAKTDLSQVSKKVKEVNHEISNMAHVKYDTGAIQQYINNFAQVESKVGKATQKIKELNDESKKTNTINNGFNQLTKGLEKMTSKIKRFGLSLFSIRSIWALVSKSSSAYLAQDTELANKLQSVWAGLGSMLAPIIDGIANILMKAVGYINIFIKALTGVDLLAKASAKSMDKTSKSAKGLNKSLAGFDELNNIDTNAGSNIDTGISNPFASIQNVELPWAETIKAFGEWVKGNIPTVIGLLGGISAGIIAIKLGLNAIKSLGISVLVLGAIKLIGDLMKYLKDPSWTNFGKIITDIGLIVLGLGIIIGGVPAIIGGAIAIIVGLIVSNWEKIRGILQNAIYWIDSKIDWIGENFGFFGKWIAEIFKGAIQVVLNVFDGLFAGIKQIFDGILMIFKGNFKNGFISIGKGIVNALIGIINGATAALNAVLYPIRSLIVEAGKILGKNWTMSNISIPKIPLLDVGTNYVPEDQLAYIHKGEAVVPKKFNSQEYFGNGNEETNRLLEQVIEAINSIEVNPYTTIRDVGKASTEFIRSEKRRLGRSVI